MPYLSPSPSPRTSPTRERGTEEGPERPTHRRTRSATPTFTYSTESGTTAFSPLPGLPRRQRQFEKKPLFQIAPDEDEEGESTRTESLSRPQEQPTFQAPGPQLASSSPSVSYVPFPSSALYPEHSDNFDSDPPTPSASRSSSISRSGSTPIILANGKTLKPSLKASASSPQISDWRAQHPRSKSEPSTPITPKTVHFPERKDNLESVVVFSKTARPRAVSGNNADDTETETEGYDSPALNGAFGDGARNRYPAEPALTLEIDGAQSSPIPASEPSQFANVHMETLVFPRTRPPSLRGSILVKNVSFEKSVALRFTLDNWQTTSEVVCRHVCTLPSLPSPFPPERPTPGVPTLAWDRFSFLVRLEDVERKLAERIIFFAARFQASGVGEWWDNNKGQNYKIAFKRTHNPASNGSGSPITRGPSPLRNEGPNPKKMFPGLDLRPSTMSLDSSDSTLPPLRLKKPFVPGALGATGSGPPAKSAPSAPATSTTSVFAAPPGPVNVSTGSHPTINGNTGGIGSTHQRNASTSSIASSGSSGSLKLSNYASPTSPVSLGRREGSATNSSNRNSIGVFLNNEMRVLDGQPISSPPPPSAAPNISPNSSTLQIPDRAGQSPPLYQRRSPTNSLLSTASPASTAPPVTPASPIPAVSSDTDTPSLARSPSLSTTTSATPPATVTPAKNVSPSPSEYPFPSPNPKPNGVSNTDSTYAALVEKWCFHQSPPPGGGAGVGAGAGAGGGSSEGSPNSDISASSFSPSTTGLRGPFSAFESGSSGYGSGYGYGHHHVGKPVSLKP